MSVRKTLCRLDEIPDAGAIAIDVERDDGIFPAIVLRQGARAFAYHNECPHAGRRLDWSPGRFIIENGQIVCAAHGASFFIETGSFFAGPSRGNGLAPIAVDVIEGDVVLV